MKNIFVIYIAIYLCISALMVFTYHFRAISISHDYRNEIIRLGTEKATIGFTKGLMATMETQNRDSIYLRDIARNELSYSYKEDNSTKSISSLVDFYNIRVDYYLNWENIRCRERAGVYTEKEIENCIKDEITVIENSLSYSKRPKTIVLVVYLTFLLILSGLFFFYLNIRTKPTEFDHPSKTRKSIIYVNEVVTFILTITAIIQFFFGDNIIGQYFIK
jgi:hypothetical protein